MGPGSRFKLRRTQGFGLGVFVCRFPFSWTIKVGLLVWYVEVGFGKGYDQ